MDEILQLELLQKKKVADLKIIANMMGINVAGLKKSELIEKIANQTEKPKKEQATDVKNENIEVPKSEEAKTTTQKKGRPKKADKKSEDVQEQETLKPKIVKKAKVDQKKVETEIKIEVQEKNEEADKDAAKDPKENIEKESVPQKVEENKKATKQPKTAEKSKNKKQQTNELGDPEEGVVEVLPDGYAFLRTYKYYSSSDDVYIPAQQVERFQLRTGDYVHGNTKFGTKKGDKYRPLVFISKINGVDAVSIGKRLRFDRLTPVHPDERLRLENDRNDYATRIIDLFSPVGKGQRGLIVSPPKAGKTVLLQRIANSIHKNNPNVTLMIVLIDERPEEVTDMQRHTQAEIIASTFDELPEHHVRVSEMALERAQRLVEMGQDVVILMDSITRLARAYNLTCQQSGRTLSGGIDPAALHKPKKFFGAARNIEGGGSLTILATALVDTGSRMDDVIYEEFKGTGNLELHLDRELAENRIFPAIDIKRSGTRREELLLSEQEIKVAWSLRNLTEKEDNKNKLQNIIKQMALTLNNNHFCNGFALKDYIK